MKKSIICILMALSLTACAGQILNQSQEAYQKGNYSQAIEKLTPLAEDGNAKAQYALGYMYYYGQGVAPNKALGQIWIDKAAAQGLPEAIQAQNAIKKQAELNPLKR